MTGQAFSLFGSSLVGFAIVWYITLETKSGLMMTIGTICMFLPQLIISLFAGVWADRHNRKLLIILADGGIAIATLLLAIVFMTGYRELWLIFLILAIRSVGSGIQTPAVSAIIPQMVPVDKLIKVNGVNGSLQSAITLLSPIAGAALLTFMPLETIFFIDVVTAIIGIGIMLVIPIKRHERRENQENIGYFEDLKIGWNFVKKNVFVREMLSLYTFYYFLITPVAFMSMVAVVRNFGDEVWRLSAIEIAFSGGMMLGGLIISYWGGFRNGINTIAMSCFIVGITNIFLFIPDFNIYMAMMAISGIFASFFYITEMALFQSMIEEDMQGRVFSWVQIVATSILPLGMFFFGPLGDIIKVDYQFLVCGILLVALSGWIFFNKKLKNEVGANAESPKN